MFIVNGIKITKRMFDKVKLLEDTLGIKCKERTFFGVTQWIGKYLPQVEADKPITEKQMKYLKELGEKTVYCKEVEEFNGNYVEYDALLKKLKNAPTISKMELLRNILIALDSPDTEFNNSDFSNFMKNDIEYNLSFTWLTNKGKDFVNNAINLYKPYYQDIDKSTRDCLMTVTYVNSSIIWYEIGIEIYNQWCDDNNCMWYLNSTAEKFIYWFDNNVDEKQSSQSENILVEQSIPNTK